MIQPRYALPNAFLPIRAGHLGGKKAAGVKEIVCAGELVITTGRLVACDAMVQPERLAFERAVAPGRYAVHLFIAKARSEIGFAEIRLRKTAVERFEMATVAGQDTADLGERQIFGYPVDSGLGSFADEAALRRLRDADAALQSAQGKSYPSYYGAVVSDELAANGGSWVNHRPDPSSDDNVVIFRSGEGDGTYATYFGLDAEGEITCIVTSFGSFKEPESPEHKQRLLTEGFAVLVEAVERDIGATLRAKGFAGPEATYKLKAGEGELELVYTRDGLSFEVLSWSRSPLYRSLTLTHFRWTRGRSTLDVGNEHRKAGLPLDLMGAVAGDGVYMHAARLGASYAQHWEALERAVMGYLPVKRGAVPRPRR